MYDVLLLLHSYLRWIVLGLAFFSFFTAMTGWLGQRVWRASDEQRHQGFIMALDLQFLIGLILYVFLSPLSKAAFADWGAAMQDGVIRFWGLEHAATMVLALVAAHWGKASSGRKKGIDRHKPMAIGIIVFAIFVFAAFPWPGLPHGRPFLRGF
jgi:uncharacterized membrane protein YozB (DUF420 family)